MTDRDEIVRKVIGVMTIAGRRHISPTPSSRPIEDFGLVSADGVEMADELEDQLGIEIPDGENILIQDKGGIRRSRTIAEIADLILSAPRKVS